jgi:hypothetical protein
MAAKRCCVVAIVVNAISGVSVCNFFCNLFAEKNQEKAGDFDSSYSYVLQLLIHIYSKFLVFE